MRRSTIARVLTASPAADGGIAMRQPQPTHAQIAQQIEKDAEEVAARLARGEERFRTIEGKLDRLLDAVACIPDMQSDLADVKEDAAKTKEIVELWAAAKVAGRAVKWLAGLATSIAALWAFAKAAGFSLLR